MDRFRYLTGLAALVTSPLLAFAAAPPAEEAAPWKPLFDGKTLGLWKETPFPGQTSPAVRVENGAIQLSAGHPLTGITWNGKPLPIPASTAYEIRFEAARLRGGDFFASLTFPAVEAGQHGTWVLGGWGGDIVGISSIDGWDASDNETRTYFEFEAGRWYTFRLRVAANRIEAWIDDQRIVNVEIRGRELSLRRGDIKLSAPLGFASYNTAGAIRKIEYRVIADSGK
jgi:hypothetical protein